MTKSINFKNEVARICYLLFIDAVYQKSDMQFSYYDLFSRMQEGDNLNKIKEEELSLQDWLMELKVKGIVLRSSDYREKDKLVEIFTLENGKLIAQLKGCKAPNAKLKFAFQPFCFAEFNLSKNGNYFLITNANLFDSFFDLVTDLDSYYLCSLILELVKTTNEAEIPNPPLFLNVLNALKYICYEKYNSKIVFLKFALDLLKNNGYQLNFNECSACHLPLLNRKKCLNLDNGSVVCSSCENQNSVRIDDASFNILKIISNTELKRLNTLKFRDNILLETIKLLCRNIENRFNTNLKSFFEN